MNFKSGRRNRQHGCVRREMARRKPRDSRLTGEMLRVYARVGVDLKGVAVERRGFPEAVDRVGDLVPEEEEKLSA